MNTVLKERYGIDAAFGEEDESQMGQEYLEKYVRTKFLVQVNGETSRL